MQRRLRTLWLGWSAILLAMGLVTIGGVGLGPNSTALAQDEEAQAEEQGGGDGDGKQSGQDGEKESKQPKTWLEWVTGALGPGYLAIFFGLSFTLVTLLVMNLLAARRENVCPVVLVEEFEGLLEEKRYQEAYELAKSDESFLGQVLSAGLGKISKGYSYAIEAMQEVAEDENMKLEHRLSYMALIGTISPMVGLFGTVHGMISSFSEIAFSGSTPSASKLAEGISTALFTTLLGLAIAIPAIAFFNILKNRVARLVLEVGILSENMMERFEKLGKKKSS